MHLVIAAVAVVALGFLLLNSHEAQKSTLGQGGADATQPLKDQNGISSTNAESAWVTYTNEELGIAFDYPKKWGTITMSTETGCMDMPGYYTDAQIADMKALLATGQPCTFATLSTDAEARQGYPGTILGASTPLYAKYPVPKGGTWFSNAIWIASSSNPMPWDDDGDDCKPFTNKQGIEMIRCAKVFEAGEGGTLDRNAFYVYSTNSAYHGFALSSARLEESNAADFDLLVDSFRFVQ